MNQLKKVRDRVAGYLEHESRDRSQLRSTLVTIAERLPRTSIFGGMLREFGLGRGRTFSSDIDLVTEDTSSDIERAVREFEPTRNRFGGFRFSSGPWRFDFWAFEDTWAFRQGLVKGKELTDLFGTTFFNLDAALYDLGRRRLLFSSQFESGLLGRVLELNLAANPAPDRMVRRAIRLATDNDLAIGPLLTQFLLKSKDASEVHTIHSSFFADLRRHVDSGSTVAYRYRPQASIQLQS